MTSLSPPTPEPPRNLRKGAVPGHGPKPQRAPHPSVSPPTPSDDPSREQVRAWRREASCTDPECFCYHKRIRASCDALLGEREAHSATRAENERMRAVVDAVVEQHAAWDALPELREDGRNIMALGRGLTRIKEANAALQSAVAALASKESNSE